MPESERSYDPRTIARDVAGVLESIFPQLVPGVVTHFNRHYALSFGQCTPLPAALLATSSLQRAMLFELAIAVGELMLRGDVIVDWDMCLRRACLRQRRYFDAQVPSELKAADKEIAYLVGSNLHAMLTTLSSVERSDMTIQPHIAGYRWIASGAADFATVNSLIEVKCTGKRFSTADYRQLVMYWLLSYARRLEQDAPCWANGILLNPRLNFAVSFQFSDLLSVIAMGRSSVEVVQSFSAIFDDASPG